MTASRPAALGTMLVTPTKKLGTSSSSLYHLRKQSLEVTSFASLRSLAIRAWRPA
jgi:hypothetical protein